MCLEKGRLFKVISERLEEVRKAIRESACKCGRREEDVTLVAVTKTYSPDIINKAIDCGVTDIGENKVQEILEKYDKVKPVRWHLIGHLQSNKVKYIIDKVCMIHSVDSLRLMDEIERQAELRGVESINILIQVNISGEESKFGIKPEELEAFFEHSESMKHVKIRGLMTILPKDCDYVTKKLLFCNINKIFLDNSHKTYHNISMDVLSMGMSGDFESAVEFGSTMVRVGSRIFGERNYDKS